MNESKKLTQEAERIHWRAWVMTQPGGVDYLMSLIGLKEKDIGPQIKDKKWLKPNEVFGILLP